MNWLIVSRYFWLMGLLIFVGCSASTTPNNTAEQKTTLTVMAAASLTDAFTEIGQQFEAQNPGVTVVFNFAGSQTLAQQIVEGAPADVFASANQKQMQVVIDGSEAESAKVAVFAKNELVVVVPQDNPAQITQLQDLAKPGTKLVLADSSVPVGQYSLEFLTKASQNSSFGADYEANVLKQVVSYEANVRAVLSKVALGEADAGIVYSSEVLASDQVQKITIPAELNIIAQYPIVALKNSPSPEAAEAFVKFLLSNNGQDILAKYGFKPILKPSS